MELLDRCGIEYNVTHTYPNGVRIGNVPWHCNAAKRKGDNQSWFPKSWGAKTIKSAGEHVAKLKKNANPQDGKKIFGSYRGVRVGVIMTKGKIGTIFPDKQQ